MAYVSFHIKRVDNKVRSITPCPHGVLYYKSVIWVGSMACDMSCEYSRNINHGRRQVDCAYGEDVPAPEKEQDDLIESLMGEIPCLT